MNVSGSIPQRSSTAPGVAPLCPVFGTCGGCQYQDVPYETELEVKAAGLQALLRARLPSLGSCLAPIVPSPKVYHYRCRLDLKLLKTRAGEVFIGFSPPGGNQTVPVEACPLAMEPINAAMPLVKRQAVERLTPKYRNANLVVKTGDDGRVFWGGIGRRSLCLPQADYLWTELEGRKVFYSLDTFFQANLSILPSLIERIRGLGVLAADSTLLDLYGGVGLFGLALAGEVRRVILVEENVYAVRLARFNVASRGLDHFEILVGRVERLWASVRQDLERITGPVTAFVDPPRQGLGASASLSLARTREISTLVYLSCNPEALAGDLAVFLAQGWRVQTLVPFDFFPRTRHLETLAVLHSPRESPVII